VSVWTCIRRISAPHATHFITPPTTRGHGMHRPVMLSSARSGLCRDVAAGPRTATRACGACGHSDEMRTSRRAACQFCLQLLVASMHRRACRSAIPDRKRAGTNVRPLLRDLGLKTELSVPMGTVRGDPASHERRVGLLSRV
jgi:hypothetical protein